MTKTTAQLDREIAEALARSPSDRQPLYGHTNESTAFVVDDYPYGYSLRTSIRYWLEYKAGKGFRFVSQTMNPKTNRWNKPKASTYSDFGGAMYLDGKGHVHWDGVGAYSDEDKVLAFVQDFPEADMRMIKQVVPAKIKFLRSMIDGTRYFTVNGVKQERSEAENDRARREIAVWEEIRDLLR